MSTPPEEQPTTAGDPTEPARATTSPQVSTAPATGRRRQLWPDSVPARIGKARTSTVALGALFVVAGLLYVPPVSTDPASGTTPVEQAPATDPAPAPTSSEVPSTTPSGDTSTTPTTTSGGTTPTTGPTTGSTSGAPATTTQAPATPTTPPASTEPGSVAPTS